MSKFCKNCGEEMNDTAAFCNKCGTKAEEQAAEATACGASCENCGGQCEAAKENTGFAGKINAFIDKLKNKDKKAISIVGGIAVVLVVILVLGIVLGASGPEKAMNNMSAVAFKGKESKIKKLAPKDYWEYVEDEYDITVEDVEDIVEDIFDMTIEVLEEQVGDDVKVKVKVKETDEVGEKTLDTMKDNIKEKYGIPKKDVKKAVELECEMTVKGDDDKEEDEATYYAVKIGSGWYICSENGTLAVDSYVSAAVAAKAADGLGGLGDLIG